jgi:glutaredoxin-related protein
MDILYYSNHCKHCQKLLAHLAKIGVLDKYNFICIDRRSIDPNTRQMVITLDRGVKTVLHPNVTRVPTLLLVNNQHKALIGDDIYTYIHSQIKSDPNNLATANGGEPIGYIMSPSSGGVHIVSETYTMYNAPPEELSAKGTGGTRQMHNYASANTNINYISTPLDETGKQYTQSYEDERQGGFQEPPPQYPNQPSKLQGGQPQTLLPSNNGGYNGGGGSGSGGGGGYSVPGVLYNTGQLVVPELQRPPPHRHQKLGEDITIDSLQQKRNMDLNNSLPYIAQQLNNVISPEISNIQPPTMHSQAKRPDGVSPPLRLENHSIAQKLNARDSQTIFDNIRNSNSGMGGEMNDHPKYMYSKRVGGEDNTSYTKPNEICYL